ncbi:putative membrane protein YfcA [Natronocella acetinitrilica]|uniref:Probable membrane transporter protein n=1 Tax=Natronocella acetinitrilica TaxID=414046 RepID=A0AAE3G146_9GAMM|nr:sulfite exporter TauE/SafE family protein [Natronocella acetinitrilica]MCP1673635.1 putative membrane protein YfcA [Natronocella acetinitrilica]
MLAALTATGLAGLMRGVTGFGGAIVMTPPLAYLIGPHEAVVTTLLLETFAAAPMLPAAARLASRRRLLPLCIGACATAPLGAWILVALDPAVTRQLIAVVVATFSLLLLAGFRYLGEPRRATSFAVGGLAGVLTASTSIGAPPAIIYLLSGPDPAPLSRANLTLFVVVISGSSLIGLFFAGAFGPGQLLLPLVLAPSFALGVWCGGKLFPYVNERLFRRIALTALFTMGLVLLLT